MATSQNLSEQDILNQLNDVDLSKVETSFPLLAPGIVPLTIGKVELRRDVEKKGMDAKPYYFVEYSLAQPWKTIAFDGVESKPVNPGDRGATFNERIYIGKYNDKNTGEEKWYGLDTIAKLREAALGKAAEGTKFISAELIGQQIMARLQFEPAPRNKDTGETYGPRSSIAAYIKKGGK